MSLRNLANATNQNNNDESQLDDNIVKQFKLILTIVFIVLILFLLYFVYNLIKCYLPKWRKNKFVDETRPVEIKHSENENNVN